MPKYNFHELKSKYNHDELPVDINSQIEALAELIKDVEGLLSLRKFREKRWFGQVPLFDDKKRHVAMAFFDHGICFRYEITAYRKAEPFQPVAIQSVKNENLEEPKKGG
jgi:hypothetical protein